MNYAIEFVCEHFSHLHSTARKRTLKHALLHVSAGLALVKVGKHEFAVEANQLFWIPQGCLCSVTYLPNTSINRCDFSVRLTCTFPHQAGFVEATPLVSALYHAIAETHDAQEKHELLCVLKRQAARLTPRLAETPLSKSISCWKPNQTKLDHSLHLALLVREAQKRRLSGVTKAQVVHDLFADNEAHCDQLADVILGRPI